MKGLLSLLIFSMVLPAHAGIVIYGTRIIYPAENKEVMVQLMNQGNRSSLLQAWIDDGDTSLPPEKIQVPFMLTPPVAKIGVNRSGNGLVIKNDSANWVTISDVKANNVKVNYETIMIAPLESQSVNVKSNNANNWHLTIIDDHGNYISDKI